MHIEYAPRMREVLNHRLRWLVRRLRSGTHRRPSWLRAWRRPLLHFLLALVVFGTGAGVFLSSLVPLPSDPVQPQASILLCADRTTLLARIGVTDRSDVALRQVPDHVRHAVLAAEDRDFLSHAGVSVTGVLRALWSNTTGGSTQGASTITQQYVKNAYLTMDQTVSRKAKEMILAVKLERRDSKDAILEHYLNTIYFGRGAYGIEAASRAYFDHGVEDLTPAEGIVLAAVIKDPSGLDPANDPEAARDRWKWIRAAMITNGWLSPAAAAALSYPVATSPATDANLPDGALLDQIEREIRLLGVTEQELHTGGLRIVTTVDAEVQAAVVLAARYARDDMVDAPSVAMVALDPRTGGVRGYFGGGRGRGYFDEAVAARPPGQLFQPVTVATALTQGFALGSRWNGRSPRMFADRGGVALYNRDDIQCPSCRLDEALWMHLNTPLYAVAQSVGPDKIAALARQFGVAGSYGGHPSLVDAENEPKPGRTRADIALGRYPVTVADMASVYGTFAAGGSHASRHFVVEISSADKQWTNHREPRSERVLPASVAADLSAALTTPKLRPPAAQPPTSPDWRAVPDPASSMIGARTTSATRYGDAGEVSAVWCAGYLPDIAVVGWIGHDPSKPLARTSGQPVTSDPPDLMCGQVLADRNGHHA